jgi:lipopolysaccharide export system permease protein
MIGPFKMLWQRYLYKETFKTLLLALFCLFALFAVIDYSVHMRGFLRIKQISPLMILAYYSLQFVKHLDILLPLALLVSTIKVLRSMSERHELLALQAAGVPTMKIAAPFVRIAILFVVCNFCLTEFFLPASTKYTEHFQTTHLKRPALEKNRLRVLELKDGSRLAFQRFDKKTNTFHDLFWVKSSDDLWRIKTMTLDTNNPKAPPLCRFVDHIVRGSDGGLHKVDSHEEISLKELKPGSYQLKKHQDPYESYSLSKLFKLLFKKNSERAEITAELFMKSIRPFLSLLAILAIVPFCMHYSRLSSPMPLYTLGIFGTIAYYVTIHAGGILTQNQITSSWLCLVLPFLFLAGLATFRFVRKCA